MKIVSIIFFILLVIQGIIFGIKMDYPVPISIYGGGVFSAKIVQQPENEPDFVDPRYGVLTQFSTAENNAFLAHSYSEGQHFSKLEIGDYILLLYSNGKGYFYTVNEIKYYQTLDLGNSYSNYINLENPSEILTPNDVFNEIYLKKDKLVLQTCIEKEENPFWGLLFVIANPHITNLLHIPF